MARIGRLLLGAVLVLSGVARAQPANDDCANATVIASVPFADSVDTTAATHALDDPTFDCQDFNDFGDEPTVWYRYTASAPISLSIDTFGSDYDTALVVHDGTCGAFTTIRTCNDDEYSDTFFNGESQAIVTLGAGESVYVEVLDREGTGGTLALNVAVTPVFQVSPWQDYGLWSSVAPVGDGFVVVWFAEPFVGGDRLVGQRFDAAGAKVGAEFQVNATPIDYPRPDVVATGDNFVVVWTNGGELLGRLFDSSGAPLGGEFAVAPDASYYDVQVASDPAGNFMVVWEESQPGADLDVLARKFDAGGTAVGPQFVVNTYTTASQRRPAIAADARGGFVVVWQDYDGQDGSGSGIFGQRIDPTGTKTGPEFQVNTYTTFNQSYPAVAADGEGNFMVFWWDDDCFMCVDARRYDAEGTASDPIRVDDDGGGFAEGPPFGAAADAVGNFLVVWPSSHYPTPQSIFGQRFDSVGNANGSLFQVTHIDDVYQYHPDAAVLASGEFVVSWDWSPFSSHYNVFGRVVAGGGGCPAAPASGCHVASLPGKAKLTLKDRTPDKGDGLVWKWVRGDDTQLAELGDPTTSDAYTLCLYDSTAKLLDVTVPPGGTCGSSPCWRNFGPDGFKYVGKGSSGPVRKIVLTPGPAGESRVIVKAKGGALVTPALPLSAPLEARLVGPGGVCWATTFAPSDVLTNTATDVKAKGGT